MNKPILLGCILSAALLAALTSSNAASPYAGQESRDIKALSADDVQSYLSGKGMGFAFLDFEILPYHFFASL